MKSSRYFIFHVNPAIDLILIAVLFDVQLTAYSLDYFFNLDSTNLLKFFSDCNNVFMFQRNEKHI